jgi:hypothetical protein
LVFHAEAFSFDDHRLGMMEQPIQDGGGLGPLLKGPDRGDNDRPLFIAQRDDLEEQIGAGLVDGEIAQLVQDEQCGFGVNWLRVLSIGVTSYNI